MPKHFATFQPYGGGLQDKKVTSLGLGDLVEKMVKPVAVALRMPCIDKDKTLKPESPCAQRRDALNKVGRAIGIGLENPS